MSKVKPNSKLNDLIDHTLLSYPESEPQAIERTALLCEQALKYHFKGVCIRPWQLTQVKNYFIENANSFTPVIASVINFPDKKIKVSSIEELRNVDIGNKLSESELLNSISKLINNGVNALDPVLNLNSFRAGIKGDLKKQIFQIMEHADKELNKLTRSDVIFNQFDIKFIFSVEAMVNDNSEIDETLLGKAIKELVEASSEFKKLYPQSTVKAIFKNSTGFIESGSENLLIKKASPQLISLCSKLLDKYDPQKEIMIKPAGGVTKNNIESIIQAGSGRVSYIGTSAAIEIMNS